MFDNILDHISIISYEGKIIKTVPIPTKDMNYQGIYSIVAGPFLYFTESDSRKILKMNLSNYEVSEFLYSQKNIEN